jgi:alkyl hydroperoxide reductase subunit AhpF
MRCRSSSTSALVFFALSLACRQTPDAVAALQLTCVPDDRDADVWIDGNYVGTVGELQGRAAGPMKLAPGAHRVEVRKSGRFPVQRTVHVSATGPASVAVDAELLEDPQ